MFYLTASLHSSLCHAGQCYKDAWPYSWNDCAFTNLLPRTSWHMCYWHWGPATGQRMGGSKPIFPVPLFSQFFENCQNTGYPLNITFIFDRYQPPSLNSLCVIFLQDTWMSSCILYHSATLNHHRLLTFFLKEDKNISVSHILKYHPCALSRAITLINHLKNTYLFNGLD